MNSNKAPLDLSLLDQILSEFQDQKGAVIPILQRAQDAYGYLPKQILAAISKKTGIPISQLYGVATFYAQFHLTRRGRHLPGGAACLEGVVGTAVAWPRLATWTGRPWTTWRPPSGACSRRRQVSRVVLEREGGVHSLSTRSHG